MCLELGKEESRDVWVWFGYASRARVFAEAAHPAPRAGQGAALPGLPRAREPKVPEQPECCKRNGELRAEAFGTSVFWRELSLPQCWCEENSLTPALLP